MKILLSNDDGYLAQGLNTLADALREVADLRVVAPDRNRSAASNSLTLAYPLRIQKIRDEVFAVNGTPTDCVHLALSGGFKDEPEMVISGINHGANLGDDTIYSGTVAAATEGRFLGLPAIAVSLVGTQPKHFVTAAQVVVDLLARLQRDPLPADTILNVNVPDLAYDELEGVVATRLGFRHRSEKVHEAKDPAGRRVYWISPAGASADAGPGTDFYAVEHGQVSVTPLKIDLTHQSQLADVRAWLERS